MMQKETVKTWPSRENCPTVIKSQKWQIKPKKQKTKEKENGAGIGCMLHMLNCQCDCDARQSRLTSPHTTRQITRNPSPILLLRLKEKKRKRLEMSARLKIGAELNDHKAHVFGTSTLRPRPVTAPRPVPKRDTARRLFKNRVCKEREGVH